MADMDHDPPIVRHIELVAVPPRNDLLLVDEEARPASAPSSVLRRRPLFLGLIAFPVAIAALYLFVIAADRYVSETKFIIRSASGGGLEEAASLVQSQGLSRATDETYAVSEYILSRDAVDLLSSEKHLRDIFDRPEGDFINRFPNFYSRDNKERLFEHYLRFVGVRIDGATGIGTLEVAAFRPEDARSLAAALLGYAEALVNRLNERAGQDALAYAEAIVARARQDVATIQNRMTAFRNQSGMIDTSRESSAALDAVARMSAELAEIEATIEQQAALTPNNPATPSLREKARSYRGEIDRLKLRVVGRDSSMSSQLGAFEQLVLEREIAVKALYGAQRNLDLARREAEQKHLYLEVIVAPDLPDQPKYPRRYLYFFVTIAAALTCYAIARNLAEIAAEHTP